MGNKLGWILAGVLVLALAGFIIWRVFFPGHSGPDATLRAGMLDLKTIEVPVSDVAGFTPSESGNAGDEYAEAARIAAESKLEITGAQVAIQEAKGRPAAVNATALGVLEKIASHVARGARRKEMKYLFVHTPKTLQVGIRVPALDALAEVTGAMETLSDCHVSHKKYDEAEKALLDLFVMGRHMIDERSHWDLVSRGIGAQRGACNRLFPLYETHKKSPERVAALLRYRGALSAFSEFYTVEKYKILWTTGHSLATHQSRGPNPGDVFNIIENDKDRAWRVQAVLMLGIIQYTAEPADAKYSRKLIGRLVGDSDEIIAAAAKAAKDLKQEEMSAAFTR